MHYERGSLHACISNIGMWWYNWGVLCQKPVSSAGIGNYIPQHLWYVITWPCPWYVIPRQHSWIKNDRKILFSTKFIWYQDMKMIIPMTILSEITTFTVREPLRSLPLRSPKMADGGSGELSPMPRTVFCLQTCKRLSLKHRVRVIVNIMYQCQQRSPTAYTRNASSKETS